MKGKNGRKAWKRKMKNGAKEEERGMKRRGGREIRGVTPVKHTVRMEETWDD